MKEKTNKENRMKQRTQIIIEGKYSEIVSLFEDLQDKGYSCVLDSNVAKEDSIKGD